MSGNDDDWLLESIIGFLSGPIWTNPIQHFFDQNCLLFNPLEDECEDETVLKEIHKKYKALVDLLLNTFLKDIGVIYEQFLYACNQENRFTTHPAYMDLFELIWSVDNYELFKSQMCRKNIELELQAILLLQLQLGVMASLYNNDDEIMRIIIQKSKNESEKAKPNISKHEMEIAKDIAQSKDTVKSLNKELKAQDKLTKQIVEMSLNDDDEAPEMNFNASKIGETPKQSLPSSADSISARERPKSSRPAASKITSDDEDKKENEAAVAALPNTVFNVAQTLAMKSGGDIDKSDLDKRAEFMRKQRELLLEKKKVEREKQLEKFVKESEKTDNFRPMSSRAARVALQNSDASTASGTSASHTQPTKVDAQDDKEKKALEARRALANTLKREVLNNFNKK